MKKTIRIATQETAGDSAGCGSAPAAAQFSAGIDTDIFEADSLALGGERFWEAFWRTQHIYGGLAEGRPLTQVLAGLGEDVLAKFHEDVLRAARAAEQLPEEEANDIFGMVRFLLSMEHADPEFDPFTAEPYQEVMLRLAALADSELTRRNS
ncbi:MAG: hypothetical protein KBD39_03045 [Sterolibacterium sp.]|nr:hypothetical protein [Sterolibacterium sp.]MBP9799076.1 hypothetical protein [Sterolibacterium sp.]